MKKTVNEKLVDWAIEKIKKDYKDDVALLIGNSAYKLEKDVDEFSLSYYIPTTEKGYDLAKTFIIDGIGYDLFPISWDRIEDLANLNKDNISSLGEGKILYYRSEDDKQHFLELQSKLQENLQDSEFMFKKALEKLNIAMELYKTMMFEDTLYKVRKASGYIVDYLSIAVANVNLTYFKSGFSNQLSDLLDMENLPEDFVKLYKEIIKASSSEELKKLCYKMIYSTRQFLSDKKEKKQKKDYNKDFNELASWYQELCYTWRRIYEFCDNNNPVEGFMWGCFLQYELDIVREEFRLEEMDLLSAFNSEDMTDYREKAETLEKQMVSIIEKHGVVIDAYSSVEDFLKKNK